MAALLTDNLLHDVGMGERRFVVGACLFGRDVGLAVSIFVRRDECENLSAIFDVDKLLSFALFFVRKRASWRRNAIKSKQTQTRHVSHEQLFEMMMSSFRIILLGVN